MTASNDSQNRIAIDQFTRQAAAFREFAEVPGHARDMVVAAVDITSADTVLDVACGPGVTTCDLAQVAGHATGIDITQAMIDQARDLQRQRRLSNVTWRVAAVPPLPFDDEAFSFVFTRYSFHHFENPRAVLKEMARVCMPGGKIVVADVFMTSAEQADSYNRMERLRDPAHERALLLDELESYFADTGLRKPKAVYYKHPVALIPLLNASFTTASDKAEVRRIIQDDVGKNQLGLNARLEDDGDIHFAYPIVVLASPKL